MASKCGHELEVLSEWFNLGSFRAKALHKGEILG